MDPGIAKSTRLGGLISGGGRTLLNLLDRIEDGRLNAELVTVVASRQCSGIERCEQAGLDVRLVPYKSFVHDGVADTPGYSTALARWLDEAEADLVVQGGFLSLWQIPERYCGRVMNIHPALLPMFGGKGMYGERVHESVLAAGCKVSGCTVHFATNEYDSGPIIVQRCVAVEEGDDPDTLAARVFAQECEAYPEAIRLFAAGRLHIEGNAVHIT